MEDMKRLKGLHKARFGRLPQAWSVWRPGDCIPLGLHTPWNGKKTDG